MSEEYKASQEDVHFDNGRADQLMRQLREASEYLHTTDSTQRSGARDQAMTEFAGPYADLFAHNTKLLFAMENDWAMRSPTPPTSFRNIRNLPA